MSETAKQLFEGLRAALREPVSQVKSELGRLGVQGSMELASALFNGSGFVPYGPGQYTPSPDQQQGHGLQQQQSRGMER